MSESKKRSDTYRWSTWWKGWKRAKEDVDPYTLLEGNGPEDEVEMKEYKEEVKSTPEVWIPPFLNDMDPRLKWCRVQDKISPMHWSKVIYRLKYKLGNDLFALLQLFLYGPLPREWRHTRYPDSWRETMKDINFIWKYPLKCDYWVGPSSPWIIRLDKKETTPYSNGTLTIYGLLPRQYDGSSTLVIPCSLSARDLEIEFNKKLHPHVKVRVDHSFNENTQYVNIELNGDFSRVGWITTVIHSTYGTIPHSTVRHGSSPIRCGVQLTTGDDCTILECKTQTCRAICKRHTKVLKGIEPGEDHAYPLEDPVYIRGDEYFIKKYWHKILRDNRQRLERQLLSRIKKLESGKTMWMFKNQPHLVNEFPAWYHRWKARTNGSHYSAKILE